MRIDLEYGVGCGVLAHGERWGLRWVAGSTCENWIMGVKSVHRHGGRWGLWGERDRRPAVTAPDVS